MRYGLVWQDNLLVEFPFPFYDVEDPIHWRPTRYNNHPFNYGPVIFSHTAALHGGKLGKLSHHHTANLVPCNPTFRHLFYSKS